jgi:hypothetical protein
MTLLQIEAHENVWFYEVRMKKLSKVKHSIISVNCNNFSLYNTMFQICSWQQPRWLQNAMQHPTVKLLIKLGGEENMMWPAQGTRTGSLQRGDVEILRGRDNGRQKTRREQLRTGVVPEEKEATGGTAKGNMFNPPTTPLLVLPLLPILYVRQNQLPA